MEILLKYLLITILEALMLIALSFGVALLINYLKTKIKKRYDY